MPRWLALLAIPCLGLAVAIAIAAVLFTAAALVLWPLGVEGYPAWYIYLVSALAGLCGLVYGLSFYFDHRPQKSRPDLYVG